MKKILLNGVVILLLGLCFSFSGRTKCEDTSKEKNMAEHTISSFDSASIAAFYIKYPKLDLYKSQVFEVYKKHDYNYIWYDKKGRKEVADVMYNKINSLKEEGLEAAVPYKETADEIIQKEDAKPNLELELFLSSYYFYYTSKVIQGMDSSKTDELEWYLPRKKQSYVDYLDSLLVNPKILDSKTQQVDQYYKLKSVLQRYRDIEKNGGWLPVKVGAGFKSIRPGDVSNVIAEIRTRLYLTGDIATDSKSRVYGHALQEAVLKYKKRNGFSLNKTILREHIDEMNVPVTARINTVIANMERCRWIPTDVAKAKEYIVVNIPSYRLTYFKDGKVVLVSNVVVGDVMNKTVVFSGMLSNIVFSPYWNIPQSIIKKEILPAIEKDKDYLAKNNMEWNGGNVRQKPGPTNSLGLIKFIFPNTNNIYLHDTPAKSLFNKEKRAFSHGCIRVAKPIELATLILEDDPNWDSEKIEEAMQGGKEKWYTLKNKIPVHIGYFTAWVDDEGRISFYKDIYEKDNALAALLLGD